MIFNFKDINPAVSEFSRLTAPFVLQQFFYVTPRPKKYLTLPFVQ